MKVKKIITAMSCAALIAATALPLTACGGGKKFKEGETLTLDNYVVEYGSDSMYNDYYDRSTISVVKTNEERTHSARSAVPQVGVNTGNLLWYTAGSGTDKYYHVYNTKSGAKVLGGVSLKIDPTFDAIPYDYDQYSGSYQKLYYVETLVASGTGEDPKTLHTWTAEDGTVILKDVETADLPDYSNGDIMYYSARLKTSPDNNTYDVISITHTSGSNKVTEYFSVHRLNSGAATLLKHEKSDIIFVDPLFEQGKTTFAATQPVANFIAMLNNDLPVKEMEGDLAAYSIGEIGNDLVFSKDGAETGRVSLDGVDIDGVGFAGNYMYYVKEQETAKDDDGANVIMAGEGSEEHYNVELHRYDVVNDKDKKVSCGYKVEGISSLYNSETKTYDALAIDGYKLVNKVAQNDFTYIVDANLVLNYDVSDVRGFDIKNLFKSDNGNYIYQDDDDITVLSDKLTIRAEFYNTHYYASKRVFSFDVNGRIGFADTAGSVVVEPKYTIYNKQQGEQFFTFFGDYTVAKNVLTGDPVILNANGTEVDFPEDGLNSKVNTDHIKDGWYTAVYGTGDSKSLEIRGIGGIGGCTIGYFNGSYTHNAHMYEVNSSRLSTESFYKTYVVNNEVWSRTITL